jgi:hypothetical protein
VPKPGRASALRLALVLVTGFAASNCAARPSPIGLADRFVSHDDGRGGADATFDVAPPVAPTRAVVAPGKAVPVAPVSKVSPGPTLESENASLRSVLAALAVRESVDGHRRAASAYWQAGIFDRTDWHLSRAIAMRPRDASLFEERARMWRDAGVLERALSDAHQSAYLAPTLPEVQNTLGTVLFALGRVDAARDRFARAAALNPAAAYAHSNLCFAALTSGALEDARVACEEALRLDPDLAAAQQNRERVEAAMSVRTPPRPKEELP